MCNTVLFDIDQIPINARMYGIKCMHCDNQFLVKTSDEEYWCFKCKDYVMVEGV